MTLAYLSTPLLGLVDTAVIGQLGDAALLGGLVVGSVLFDLVFVTFNFLRSGTTALTAQAYGADESEELKLVLLRALAVGLGAGLLIAVIHPPVLTVGLELLGGSPEVQTAAREYFSIRVYFAFLTLANFVVLGWFLGLGMAKTGLLLQTVLNGLNIGLSVLFVLILDLGIAGVAYATVISEGLTLLLGIAVVVHRLGGIPKAPLAAILDRSKLFSVMALNRDIMIRSFTLLFALSFFTARSADQGDVYLAANAILEKFFLIAGYFLDGSAVAAEQLVGRAIGANYRPAFRKSVRLSIQWGFGTAGVLTLFFWLFGENIVGLMTVNEQVRAVAATYMMWAVLTPVAGNLAFQMDGIFIGATWSNDMRNMMLVSLGLFLVCYYVLFPLFGNHGLWLSLLVFLSIRGITLTFRCFKREERHYAALGLSG